MFLSFAGRDPGKPMPIPHQPVVSRRALLGGGAVLLTAAGGLAAWQTGLLGGKGSPGNSVAVLPFRNLSGDAAQDYFAEGISEQIRLALSRNAELLVLAPTTIAAAAGTGGADPKGLAARLGVAFVLSGVVRRSGDLLRISAELSDGKTGFASWTDKFDRKLDDVFAIQEGIADAVAAVMAAQTVAADKSHKKEPGGTDSIKAYDAYLRGNAFYALRSGEAAYRSALAQYDLAIAEDPDFAAAYAARARVIVVITSSYARAGEFKAAYADALASARKAVRLAPDLATAHSALGYVLTQGMLDLRAARAPLEQARKLGAGDAGVLSLYSALAAEHGRKADAEKRLKSAYDAEKTTLRLVDLWARFQARNGDFTGAAETYAGFDRLLPNHPIIREGMALVGRKEAPPRQITTPQQGAAEVLYGLASAGNRQGDEAAALLYLAVTFPMAWILDHITAREQINS